MRIVRIFASAEKLPGSGQIAGLFAVRYPEMPENENALSELLNRLLDYEYLTDYFRKNEKLISQGFYKNNSVTNAVGNTISEVMDLMEWLKELESKGPQPFATGLEAAFKYLDDNRTRPRQLELVKTKNRNKPRWIRMYAIRVNKDFYIITGGGIKLVQRIEDDIDLIIELRKMERIRNWLVDEGRYDPEHYLELEI